MNSIIEITLISWIFCQIIKYPIYYFKNGTNNFSIIFSTGSMPSSHTAVVATLAFEVGQATGYTSPEFAIAFILMGVVIHDAVKVRGESNKQAKAINQIFEIVNLNSDHNLRQEKLKELIGHTASEVFVGFIIGLIISFLF